MKLLPPILLAAALALGLVPLAPAGGIAATHTPVTAPTNTQLRLFSTETEAQAHCQKDTVVRLNTNSGTYHLRGERWYGRTKHGAYVCKEEADAVGDRETRNGQ